MTKPHKLLIVGAGSFAEVVYDYFTEESEFEVVGFAVESEYLSDETLFDLPIVSLDAATSRFPPEDHAVFVAITYNEMNRLRTRLVKEASRRGYTLASFVSKEAKIAKSARIGEHCFILEGSIVQPFVSIKDNVILWSRTHIGHHSTIEENCFLAHAVISGFCTIGRNSFLGGNAMIANNIKVSEDNWVGPGVVISKDTAPGELYGPPKQKPAKVSSLRYFRVKD
jgi:sugar O-acyltransferase (sialic acid O-acetyltransferase NeuD family)